MGFGARPGDHLTDDAQLEQLSIDARAAEHRGDFTEELRLWRIALSLLTPGTEDHDIVKRRIIELGRMIDGAAASPPHNHSKWKKILGPAAPVAFLIWKFKAIVFGLRSSTSFLSAAAVSARAGFITV